MNKTTAMEAEVPGISGAIAEIEERNRPLSVGDVIAKVGSRFPPTFIKVTITEEDRQKADKFYSCQSCLIATALRRIGFNDIQVGTKGVLINDSWYAFDCECGRARNIPLHCGYGRPFYAPEVVGTVISLTFVMRSASYGFSNSGGITE